MLKKFLGVKKIGYQSTGFLWLSEAVSATCAVVCSSLCNTGQHSSFKKELQSYTHSAAASVPSPVASVTTVTTVSVGVTQIVTRHVPLKHKGHKYTQGARSLCETYTRTVTVAMLASD